MEELRTVARPFSDQGLELHERKLAEAVPYTDDEIPAMREKRVHPRARVLCPRCGQELLYREVGNSCEVKCQTQDCIKMTVRGI